MGMVIASYKGYVQGLALTAGLLRVLLATGPTAAHDTTLHSGLVYRTFALVCAHWISSASSSAAFGAVMYFKTFATHDTNGAHLAGSASLSF